MSNMHQEDRQNMFTSNVGYKRLAPNYILGGHRKKDAEGSQYTAMRNAYQEAGGAMRRGGAPRTQSTPGYSGLPSHLLAPVREARRAQRERERGRFRRGFGRGGGGGQMMSSRNNQGGPGAMNRRGMSHMNSSAGQASN